ncbi:hypothetical protein [Salmonella enterica]|nr:hypothetical protein [Salmonella enterica]ECC1480408.1 hypothetical protein [Salmonella enterica subsp. salamae]ECC1654619.1 hypothetical protein [Salmonella enterica subsp. salamae]ECD9415196.1 hypothetical protein [Salmonella enterica subsp. salamae]ECF5929866.1 hypothetical protein [Salmonella enterica subsp. salamae]EDV5903961.1 hypothetical protein [Salmonella enterica subsp. salamae]
MALTLIRPTAQADLKRIYTNSIYSGHKKTAQLSGFFVLVRFAAFPAGFVAIATQAHRSELILPFKGTNVKMIYRETIQHLMYYPFRPFPPSRKRALASGEDDPWP